MPLIINYNQLANARNKKEASKLEEQIDYQNAEEVDK